jgi:hypothetical protein
MDPVPSPDEGFPGLWERADVGPEAVSPDDQVIPEPLTEVRAILGRRDIDSAMVDALRHAMDSDHGLAAPAWVVPLPEQPAENHRGDGGDSMPEPRALSGRCDIDSAMVEALRHAMVGDRSSPRA